MSDPTVLHMLQRNPKGVCGTRMRGRFSARIFELRDLGHIIDKERCDDPWHGHRTVQWRYVLRQGGQMVLR